MTHQPSRRRVLRGAAAALGGSLLTPMICAEGIVQSPGSPRFAIGENDFQLDGKPMQIRCGEIHFARVPR